MLRGADLWLPEMPTWERAGSFLLLNPRMPQAWRERVLESGLPAGREDAVWLATSGTSGAMKLVALSRSAMEASARAVNEFLQVGRGEVWINPLPTFHVGGMGIAVRAELAGNRWVPSGTWSAEGFVRAAEDADATLASLVPTQVHDLVAAGCRAPRRLRAVVVGGGGLAEELRLAGRDLGWPLLRSYGLTEASSQVATEREAGDREGWLTLLPHLEAKLDEGVLCLRGPSLLDGWLVFTEEGEVIWEDPKVDGWLRTGDRAELSGGKVRILGRVDDLVKIRGELVDVAALERELQSRVGSGVMVRPQQDARTGAGLRVVAESPEVAAAALEKISEIFPPYARPLSVEVGALERTVLGKMVRR
jgi:O-succinylbenzoic acid--CoA ligase